MGRQEVLDMLADTLVERAESYLKNMKIFYPKRFEKVTIQDIVREDINTLMKIIAGDSL